MKLDTEFIRLPYRFDAERLAEEVSRIPTDAWIPHPDGYAGNFAVPLISLRGQSNNDFNGEMKPSPHLENCEYIKQVLSSFGEVFGRSRLMRLDGNSEVKEHTDVHHHWHFRVRIHVPILTYPEVKFHCGDQQVHMGKGECWIFNSWLRHRVVNPTPHTRIHLVMDTTGSSKFWRTVTHSEWPFALHDREIMPDRFVSYVPGRRAEIRTEKYNVMPVMAPGEIEFLTEDLISDFRSNAENDYAAVEYFADLFRSFYKDWRQVWSCYGFSVEGVPIYEKLIKAVIKKIQSVPISIKTASNMNDVVRVYSSRVLSVALCKNVYEDILQIKRNDCEREELKASIKEADPLPVVDMLKNQENKTDFMRNDLCYCASGKKFKHCHGKL